MARGKYLSLEEARKDGTIKRFCKEHPSVGNRNQFDRLFDAMAHGGQPTSRMTKRRKRRSQCPAEDCMAADPRQRSLTEGERVRLPQESWVAAATYCTYCQCVYTRDQTGTTVHGFLDNLISGKGWHPLKSSSEGEQT